MGFDQQRQLLQRPGPGASGGIGIDVVGDAVFGHLAFNGRRPLAESLRLPTAFRLLSEKGRPGRAQTAARLAQLIEVG